MRETVLRLMLFAGVLVILAGVVILATLSQLVIVGPIYSVLGLVMILFGVFWVYKVHKVANRYSRRRLLSGRHYALIALAALSTASLLASVAYAQEYSADCLYAYIRIRYVEYALIGFLIIAGFLSFGPIILGRTILGPILQELQYIAGAMLILLIFALLVVFPLDPMFVLDDPTNPKGCYVDVRRLMTNGPPLLQIILRLILPPPPSF